MRIRRLELVGFKSFSERTLFQFSDRISCVVGPNGCGKSNVIDALRWLLGEQNPRLLRGQAMEDLIFGGTGSRPATGLAEATMVLDNREGLLGERFAGFPEIEIGRRLYRDGESVYMLNGSRCRLKDITDLFLDTGVGARAASIIEQGKVADLIVARPEERRAIIEEAAGIVGYKARRAEAQRRLESTEQNLLRVSDLVDELRRQSNALRRQAAKANRYRRLQAERKENEILLILAATREHTEGYREWSDRYGDLRSRREELDRRERQLRLLVEAQRQQLADAGDAVDRLKGDQARLQADLHRRQSQREYSLREIEQLQERTASLDQGVLDSQARSERLAEDEASLREELRRWTEELRAREQVHRERRQSMSGVDERLEACLADQALARQEERAASADLARSRADVAALERTLADHRARVDLMDRDFEEARGRLKDRREVLSQAEMALREVDERIVLQRARVADMEEEVERQHEAWAQMMATLDELKALVMERTARQRSLAEVLDRHEGFDRGVREVMKHREEANGSSGILGTVADVIEVPARFEQAIEAALGASLQGVLVESHQHGLSALNVLKEREAGRTSFLPRGDLRASGDGGELSGEGVIAEARDVVSVDDGFGGVADHLLSDVVVVEDMDDALRIWRANGQSKRLVTLDGDVVDPSGVVTGGSPGSGGVLGQKRELRTVQAEIEELRGEEGRAREAVDELSGAMDAVNEELERARAEMQELEVRRATVDSQRQAAAREVDAAARTLARLAEERERLADAVRGVDERSRRHLDAITGAERALEGLGERLAELDRQVESLRQQRERHQGQSFEAELAVADARARRDSVAERLEQTEAAAAEIRERIGRDRDEQRRNRERIADRRELIDRLEGELEDGGREIERLGVMLAEAIERRGRLAEEGQGLEQQLAEVRDGTRALDEQVQEAATHVTRLNVEIEHLRRDMREGFGLELRELFATLEREGAVELTIRGVLPRPVARAGEDGEPAGDDAVHAAGEGRGSASGRDDAGGETRTDESGGSPGIEVRYRWEMLNDDELLDRRRQALERVRRDLDRMGQINMAAPEAYEEIKARHDALQAQMKDLQDSMDQIRRGIHRLNRASRDLFARAFEGVDAHLRELYPRLTGGGQAFLAMTEPDDLLETGIEVHVQPPGKKLKAMGLLSGGEKAIAALSLVFAVFLYRPSPFCLLDEVDAALDEANVKRFNQLLRELSERTQFLVITHKRATMETADMLYGVTMHEPGVSTLVTVRLDDVA